MLPLLHQNVRKQWNHGFQSFGTGKVQAEVEYTETTFQLRADVPATLQKIYLVKRA